MKLILISLLFAVIFSACSTKNSDHSDKESKTDTSKTSPPGIDTSAKIKNIQEISPTFNNISPAVASSVKMVVDDYLAVKNALSDNNVDDARKNGKAMNTDISKVDRSLLTPDQKKIFEQEEADLLENSEHIGKTTELEHQRMHFSVLSEGTYVIVKAFGGGKVLFHMYCPKAENGEGALWLSESADDNNPYIGKGSGCDEIVEKIK